MLLRNISGVAQRDGAQMASFPSWERVCGGYTWAVKISPLGRMSYQPPSLVGQKELPSIEEGENERKRGRPESKERKRTESLERWQWTHQGLRLRFVRYGSRRVFNRSRGRWRCEATIPALPASSTASKANQRIRLGPPDARQIDGAVLGCPARKAMLDPPNEVGCDMPMVLSAATDSWRDGSGATIGLSNMRGVNTARSR